MSGSHVSFDGHLFIYLPTDTRYHDGPYININNKDFSCRLGHVCQSAYVCFYIEWPGLNNCNHVNKPMNLYTMSEYQSLVTSTISPSTLAIIFVGCGPCGTGITLLAGIFPNLSIHSSSKCHHTVGIRVQKIIVGVRAPSPMS